MPRFRLNRPRGALVTPKGAIGISGNLTYTSVKSVGSVLLNPRGVTQVQGNVQPVIPPVQTGWVIPDLTFQSASGGTFDTASKLPGTVATGGTFDVDASGAPLPIGMQLNAQTGILNVGSANIGTTGVILGYNEPVVIGPTSSVLTLYSDTAQAGARPWLGTFYPLESTVATGKVLTSQDDASMRCTVLSRWDDGSAKVCVLAGSVQVDVGVPKQIRLQVGDPSGSALTAARISALVTNVTVNMGALGTYQITNFATPARTWWANERVICARYYLPMATAQGNMVAAIDVHAFAAPLSRALVEVQIENSLVNPLVGGGDAMVSAPSTKTFSNSTVTVNGSAIGATISSPTLSTAAGPGGEGVYKTAGMLSFRAFVQTGWVGGDPLVEVCHDATYMQSHPIYFRAWKPVNPAVKNLQTVWGNRTYVPWSMGDYRGGDAGGTGDMPHIGIHPEWDVDYMRSGSRHARKASIANGKSFLHYPVNYRHYQTYAVLTHTDVADKGTQGGGFGDGNWPGLSGVHGVSANDPCPEQAHNGSAGLTAFLCQPSPMFIEAAQKNAIWHTTILERDNRAGFFAQGRGRAWYMRTHGHAVFLTPDGDAWKSPAQTNIDKNVQFWDRFRDPVALDVVKQYLGFIFDNWVPSNRADTGSYGCFDHDLGTPGMQYPIWFAHWQVMVMHTLSNAKLQPSGAMRTSFDALTNWVAKLPVRMVNECNSGQGYWRYNASYDSPVGLYNGTSETDNPRFDSHNTWGEAWAWKYGTPPSDSGLPLNSGAGGTDPLADDNYFSHFSGALSCAVERGITGCDAAWSRVIAGIPSSFYDGFGDNCNFGVYPRNK